MPIIKRNGERVVNYKEKEGKLYLDDIKLKKGDTLLIKCDACPTKETVKFRSFKSFIGKKFINGKTYCASCLRKQTNLYKYGVENLSQSPEIQAKIKANSLEKYGTEHFLSAKEIRNKIDQTNIEKYGNKNIFQVEEIKQKSKKTMNEKYGVDYSLQSKEIKKKFEKSMFEKYGALTAMRSFELKEKRRTSIQSVIADKIFEFKHITPMFEKDEFIGINKFYKWKCNDCNTTFEDHLDYGHIPRCPRCHPKMIKINRRQQELVKWMDTVLDIPNIQLQEKNLIHPYEISIYIPQRDIGFDLISLYWDAESQGKDKNYHINKISKAVSKDVELFLIFEDEWVNKQKIIKSIIKQKLGLHNKILLREDCFIQEISNREARFFYNKNHLQGHVNSLFNYGLFHQKEGLIACLSASKSRFNPNYQWEVTRFANRINIEIYESFEILFNHFREQQTGSVIAYADCRYFDSYVYQQAGFKHVSRSEPNYFYTNYQDRHNRLQFQKNRLKGKIKYFDPEMTEWQNMQMNGWDRIWDCGSDVYVIE